jgi:hypothetical protein
MFPNLTGIHVFTFHSTRVLHYFDSLELSNLLESLDNGSTYVISPELINFRKDYNTGDPVIILSDPIIISKESNPDLISDYLLNQMIKAFVDYSIDDNKNNCFKILLKYNKINLSNGII